jgi:superfamily II DNA or RNA helicase
VDIGPRIVSLSNLNLHDGLSSSSSDLLEDFYVPCLENSILYQRAVGYFSSGLLALAPIPFANFVSRGGKIQIVCSPNLRPEDLKVLRNEQIPESMSRSRVYEDLVTLSNADDLSNALAIALSSLLNSEILDLRLLLPLYSDQLFHDKLGIFSDEKNDVSFVGSANETAAAWVETGNHENIEVFRSWTDEADKRRVARHKTDFQVLWNGPIGWKTIRKNEVKDLIFSVVQPENVEISLTRVGEIIKSKRSKRSFISREKTTEKRNLRPYQSLVLENWRKQNMRGIVVFATGGGKTLTAIDAIREWISDSEKQVLVLVPSQLLHSQWISEILEEIPSATIIRFGAGSQVAGREALLRSATGTGNSIVVSTYATAGSQKFIDACNFSENLLIVADEVHTAGQPEFRKFLEMEHSGPRLGLSATPERFGDEDGTQAIFSYFGDALDPKFGIVEAIESGALVPYSYEYLKVALTDEEFEKWDELSKKISIAAARSSEDHDQERYLKNLLIERSRIAKSAKNKIGAAWNTLREQYTVGDRWLVYCSDVSQLREVKLSLSGLNLPLLEYHQAMVANKASTLKYFGEQGGVMLAIKCLDEGVDIPEINKAIILASSTNPREYIQRRGRVLRSKEGKYSASIWDTLITNPSGQILTTSEAKRALEFAKTSTSESSKIKLYADMQHAGITIDLENQEFEEPIDAEQ